MEELINQIKKTLQTLQLTSEHMAFQNHLYGCLYLSEMIEKKEITDLEPFRNTNIFNDIGKTYGYEESTFLSSDNYRYLWNKFFDSVFEGKEGIDVLELESRTVDILDVYEDHMYFLDQLSENEYEEEDAKSNEMLDVSGVELLPKEDEHIDSTAPDVETIPSLNETNIETNRRRKTAHFYGRRSITPIKHKKGTGKTRKNRRKV